MEPGVVGIARNINLYEDSFYAYIPMGTDLTFNAVINFLQHKYQVLILDVDYETKQAQTIGNDENMIKFHLELIKLFGPLAGIINDGGGDGET